MSNDIPPECSPVIQMDDSLETISTSSSLSPTLSEDSPRSDRNETPTSPLPERASPRIKQELTWVVGKRNSCLDDDRKQKIHERMKSGSCVPILGNRSVKSDDLTTKSNDVNNENSVPPALPPPRKSTYKKYDVIHISNFIAPQSDLSPRTSSPSPFSPRESSLQYDNTKQTQTIVENLNFQKFDVSQQIQDSDNSTISNEKSTDISKTTNGDKSPKTDSSVNSSEPLNVNDSTPPPLPPPRRSTIKSKSPKITLLDAQSQSSPQLPKSPRSMTTTSLHSSSADQLPTHKKQNLLLTPQDSLSTTSAPMSYRQRILNEMVESEYTYVMGLKICSKFYKDPLYKKRFDDVNRINQKLLQDLNELLNHVNGKSLDTDLGEALCNFVPLLNVYKLYVGNTESQHDALDKLESNKGFKKLCSKLQSKINIGHALNLRAYLITPVQRLPRYKLLLEDLIRNTEEDHCDYERLKNALEKVKSINVTVNKSVDVHARQEKLVEISKKIKGYDQLIQPTRYYIHDGELTKITKKGKSTRHFFLFNDIIMYTKKSPDMTIKFSTDIVSVMITDDSNISFNILSPSKSFTMLCKNEEDKREWINQIVDAINNQQQLQTATQQKRSVKYAPLLSYSSHKCQLCDKSFGFMNKKQFCVHCGLCVCNSCYKGRFVLNGVNKRGCDRCMKKALSQNKIKLDENAMKRRTICLKTDKEDEITLMFEGVDLQRLRSNARTKQTSSPHLLLSSYDTSNDSKSPRARPKNAIVSVQKISDDAGPALI
ncbi:Rho/RAC guanine nucleotide exchange factor [Entamoeba marina]